MRKKNISHKLHQFWKKPAIRDICYHIPRAEFEVLVWEMQRLKRVEQETLKCLGLSKYMDAQRGSTTYVQLKECFVSLKKVARLEGESVE